MPGPALSGRDKGHPDPRTLERGIHHQASQLGLLARFQLEAPLYNRPASELVLFPRRHQCGVMGRGQKRVESGGHSGGSLGGGHKEVFSLETGEHFTLQEEARWIAPARPEGFSHIIE